MFKMIEIRMSLIKGKDLEPLFEDGKWACKKRLSTYICFEKLLEE